MPTADHGKGQDLPRQIEAKDNAIKEPSKGWDNMLNTASQVTTDLRYLVKKNPSPGFTSADCDLNSAHFHFQYIS
jgi:hypothetical protein